MIDITQLYSPNRMSLWIEPVLDGCTLEKAAKLQDIACKDEIELRASSSFDNSMFSLKHHQEFFLVKLKDECDINQLISWLESDMLQFSWISNIHHGRPSQDRVEAFLEQNGLSGTDTSSTEQQQSKEQAFNDGTFKFSVHQEHDASAAQRSKQRAKVDPADLLFDGFIDDVDDSKLANSESMDWPDLVTSNSANDSVIDAASGVANGTIGNGTVGSADDTDDTNADVESYADDDDAQGNTDFDADADDQEGKALGASAAAANSPTVQARQLLGLSFEIEVVFVKCGLKTDVWNILPEEWVKSEKDEAEAVDNLRKVLNDCRLRAYDQTFYFYLPSQQSAQNQLSQVGRTNNQELIARGNLGNANPTESQEETVGLTDGMLILGSAGCVRVQVQRNSMGYRFIGKIDRRRTFKGLIHKANLTACCLEIKCDPSAKDDWNNLNTQVALQQAQNNPSIYLKLWTQYNAIELKNHARQAQARGYAVYNKYAPQGDNCFDFWLEPGSFYTFKPRDIVDVSVSAPQFKEANSELKIFEDQLHGRLIDENDEEHRQANVYLGEVQEISTWDKKTIRIVFNKAPDLSEKGFISISLRGYQVQHKRREQALNMLKEGTAGIKSLPRFFNLHSFDGASSGAASTLSQYNSGFKGRKGKNIEALTPRVRTKVFKHEPTINQLDAISMALNTPDIALIQGPPGTGKTTVIQAIVERLNEIMCQDKNKRNNLQGQILISSYQHEAVDNAISRLSLNSLPTFKFGNRRSETNQRIYRACEQWRLSVLDKLHTTCGDKLQLNPDALQVQKAIAQYECAPSDVHAKEIVLAISSLPHYVFNDELNDKLRREIERLSHHAVGVDPVILENSLQHVYALRTEPMSFADDGLFNLHRARTYLELLLDVPELKQRLQQLCTKATNYTTHKEFFVELKQLQRDLIDYLRPEPIPIQQKPNRSTLDLIRAVSECIERTAANYEISAAEGEDRKVLKILSKFANTLENNIAEVNSTLRSMNVVVAATVQQTMNNDLISYKRSLARGDEVNAGMYDTVIIDEAARSMPIDLLIPMVLASRRIILVGDHKQLPHIVDDVIERQLFSMEQGGLGSEQVSKKKGNALAVSQGAAQDATQGRVIAQAGGQDASQELAIAQEESTQTQSPDLHEQLLQELNNITPEQMLNLSMFEFLFSNLKKLEVQDGIVRTITLDHQFRMHPALGKLISSEFYDGQLFSPLDASYFDHELDEAEHCYARWYNIPSQMGLEERKGTSRIRLYEAQCIIWRLRKWLKHPSSRGMSFGVVCFYREQVNLLRELAIQAQLFVQDGDKLKLAAPYDDVTVIDRLRIDTVDAFQGKEFDVVLLSMVRSISMDKLNQAFKRLTIRSQQQTKPTKQQTKQLKNTEMAKTDAANTAKVDAVNAVNTNAVKVDTSSAEFWALKENLRLQQQVFGHLMSLNRLCVALSRQRKMLCVFGDLALIEHPLGQHAVPALSKFADMCKKEKQVLTLVR